jgi:YidC/Oxa1 family membrane protein insertase
VLYNGPVKVRLLGQLTGERAVDPQLVERYLDTLDLRTLTDYHTPGAVGEFAASIGWSWVLIKCTNFMHNLLWFLHKVIPSYGLCIILMTLLVRGLMFPISRRQAATSVKMQALAPEMKKLQEKFKDDPQARNLAVMDLYRKHGVHPLGSCWIVFLQMPIFLGLYYALQESIHFRLAPFLWMDNLAAPDMLIWWTEKIPWISDPAAQGGFFYLGPYFNLLPVVAVSFMLVQQKMLTPPPADEQQEMQQKMMKWMMVVMGILFYKVASGLCVYFIVSSLWGMTERQLLPKAKPAVAGGAEPPPSKNGPRKGPQRAKAGPTKVQEDGVVEKIRRMWEEILKEARKK